MSRRNLNTRHCTHIVVNDRHGQSLMCAQLGWHTLRLCFAVSTEAALLPASMLLLRLGACSRAYV